MPGNDWWNKNVFSCRRKEETGGVDCTSSGGGGLFQKMEAATGNERRPAVGKQYGGTSYSCSVNDDRRRRRPDRLDTGTNKAAVICCPLYMGINCICLNSIPSSWLNVAFSCFCVYTTLLSSLWKYSVLLNIGYLWLEPRISSSLKGWSQNAVHEYRFVKTEIDFWSCAWSTSGVKRLHFQRSLNDM